MKLEEHIHILQNLRVPFKLSLAKILWIVFQEHHQEIKDIDEFIDQIRYIPENPIEPIRKRH